MPSVDHSCKSKKVPANWFLHNYHTHTRFCKHASVDMEEMINVAITNGFKTIGFSEHAPLAIHRMFRLNLSNLNEYLSLGAKLKKKYRKQIKVLIGLECEFHQQSLDFYQKLKNTKGVDYLIFGNHVKGDPMDPISWDKQNVDLNQYLLQVKMAFEAKLFAFIAHPDYILHYYGKWDQKAIKFSKDLIELAIKFDVPLGFNLNGFRFKKTDVDYPCQQFWQLVGKSKAKVLIEADAHHAASLDRNYVNRSYQYAVDWKFLNNVIDQIC